MKKNLCTTGSYQTELSNSNFTKSACSIVTISSNDIVIFMYNNKYCDTLVDYYRNSILPIPTIYNNFSTKLLTIQYSEVGITQMCN